MYQLFNQYRTKEVGIVQARRTSKYHLAIPYTPTEAATTWSTCSART
jgi:hypothetical protein